MGKLARLTAVLAGLVLVLALASCGDSDDSTSDESATEATTSESAAAEEEESAEEGGGEVAASEADTTVKATLGEYYIKPAAPSTEAGNVKFEVTNDGKLEHEFVVIKTDTAPGDLPLSDGNVDEEAAGEVPGEIPSVMPGATEEVTLKLDPGKYVLICNLPGHYAAGQYSGFSVE